MTEESVVATVKGIHVNEKTELRHHTLITIVTLKMYIGYSCLFLKILLARSNVVLSFEEMQSHKCIGHGFIFYCTQYYIFSGGRGRYVRHFKVSAKLKSIDKLSPMLSGVAQTNLSSEMFWFYGD